MGEPQRDVESLALPEVLRFMQLLWAIVHALERKSKWMTREIGVTGPQRLVLRVIGLFPGLSAGELARVLHVHPSTLTGMLRRLVDGGLLTRVEHRDDRRRAVLRLTAKGARVNRSKVGTAEAAASAALREMSESDRESAKRALSILAGRLDQAAHPPRSGARTIR